MVPSKRTMSLAATPPAPGSSAAQPHQAETLARLAGAALDRALSRQAVEWESGRPRLLRTAFWPSDLFSCRRKVALGFREVPRDESTPRLAEVRHWGTVLHEAYYRRLLELPQDVFRVVATEQPVVIRLPGIDTPLRGRYDVLIASPVAALAALVGGEPPGDVDPDTEVRWLVDLKTVTPYVARDVAARGQPLRGDAAEMLCYLHATGLPFGVVVYHDKTSGIRELAPVVYDEGAWQEVVDWIRSVYDPLRRGEIPPADYDPLVTDFPCTYCPFRTVCLALGPGPTPTAPPTSSAPPSLPAAVDQDTLRARASALLEEIVRLEAAAARQQAAAAPLRAELLTLVQQLGRVESASAVATLVVTTRWDLERLRTRLVELGRLEDVLEPSVARVQQLIQDGQLPASLLSDCRSTVPGGLRITRRRGAGGGEAAHGS